MENVTNKADFHKTESVAILNEISRFLPWFLKLILYAQVNTCSVGNSTSHFSHTILWSTQLLVRETLFNFIDLRKLENTLKVIQLEQLLQYRNVETESPRVQISWSVLCNLFVTVWGQSSEILLLLSILEKAVSKNLQDT